MRLGFVTCVQIGLEVLDEIREQGCRVDAIVTLEDNMALSKSGRVFLDDMAERHSANLHKTRNINDPSTTQWLNDQNLDWLFIIGWSQIAGRELLDLPRLGCLGMHPSLLPVGRGRASIPWAIIKGLTNTGVTLFHLDDGVDTGPIVDAVEIPIKMNETGSSLYLSVVEAHRELIKRNIASVRIGEVTRTPQDDERATYWPGRRPSDGQLLPEHSLAEIDRLVRALAPPYPPAWWVDPRGRTWNVIAGTPTQAAPGLRIPAVDGIYIATVFELCRPGTHLAVVNS